ncbi:hypothetical protein EVJ58_g4498 [Rhodofomes roseus]|uniref:Uncharacterized protein n=1 Tax=Rhodofomes roseus TaxID=34475 RepID=A0A4Y9YKL2_9APHY|nr:hypothetical protein EVJ58_g4498 [Rhodofomes roseus]
MHLVHRPTSAKTILDPDFKVSTGSTDSVSVSVYDYASVAVPPPVHDASSRLLPRNATTEEGGCTGTSRVPYADQVFVHGWSLKTCEPVVSDEPAMHAPVPLTPTTRPLNGMAETRNLSLSTDSLSPTGVLAGRRRTARPKALQKRRSCSPQLGPSPLRNSFMLEPTASLSILESSRPGSSVVSVCPSWELDDLLVDGQLDVNAVSVALGLGLSMASNEAIGDYGPESVELNVFSPSHNNASEGFLTTTDTWERAHEPSSTTPQVHIPGEQLFAIPEEAEDALSVNMSMRGSLHSQSTGIRLSEIDADFLAELTTASTSMGLLGKTHQPQDCRDEIVWEDEQRWRDTVDSSGSIGQDP